VQLVAIDRALVRRALVQAVEEMPDQLVGDQQPQQPQVAPVRKDPEQRCAIGVPALVP
jgi:hypothetical protein